MRLSGRSDMFDETSPRRRPPPSGWHAVERNQESTSCHTARDKEQREEMSHRLLRVITEHSARRMLQAPACARLSSSDPNRRAT